ncbi:hypothetical protein BGZ58_009679 [Dissophora ornata]|nr:hypothetical protein BGZ58_009679 [Dissophora ornata]
MTNDRLNLFCLVDDEPLSSAFSVKATPNDTVDDLKNHIKAKKSPRFDDIAADELTLWRVSIPVPDDDNDDDDDNDESPILLDSIPKSDKKRLKATHDLSDVFKEAPPKKTIHIIVQRPPPATPIPSLFIPQDKIEAELTDILEGVSHNNVTNLVNAMEVETSQRKALGRFYKRPLPYHEKAENISLVMLGLELDKQAKTSEGETLREIVEKDVGRSIDLRVVAMVAPSGSGKTATVIDLASRHFVLYTVCCVPSPSISPGFQDPNFIRLSTDVESIYRDVIHRNQGTLLDAVDTDSEVKAKIGDRVRTEFLARFLFLLRLLDNNPALEPRQFFRELTSKGGALTIERLVRKMKAYTHDTVQALLSQVEFRIQRHLRPRQLGVVIALDEAQAAANEILPGKLISPSALAKHRKILFDDKGHIRSEFRRGFLTQLSATLSNMQATLVILGTALSLQNAEHVYSAVAKQTNDSRITDFPRFDRSDVSRMLSDLVDMDDCVIPEAKRRKLEGRPRFVVDVINRLTKPSSSGDDKQVVLENAIDRSIEHTMEGLRRGVRTILANDQGGGMTRLLSRMVLAYHLHGGKISFAGKDQADFVDKALCRLRPHPDGIHFVMDEAMVVEAVEIELKASGKDPAFLSYLDQIFQVIGNLGVSSTSKGDAFEPLVRRCLQRFNGYRVIDLPFLRGVKLPTWCNTLTLQIDAINTANGFGYKDSGLRADLAFLTERPPNKMLIAGYGTRPDGAWFFSDNHYAGSLGIKLYGENISEVMHKKNETSSDLRSCFLCKDGSSVNKSLSVIRKDYENSGVPSDIRGILRIHLEFPGVCNGNPVTHVKTDHRTNTEDVMVYINLSNMDSFFFEDIVEYRDDVVKLKSLITLIAT